MSSAAVMVLIPSSATPSGIGIVQEGTYLMAVSGCCGTPIHIDTFHTWEQVSWLCGGCGEEVAVRDSGFVGSSLLVLAITQMVNDVSVRNWLSYWTGWDLEGLDVTVQT